MKKSVCELCCMINQAIMWHSSVFGREIIDYSSLTNQDNMCQTVLSADALTEAIKDIRSFDIAIEVGPHPALKGPATNVING